MQVGDLIRFTATGCHGVITQVLKVPVSGDGFVYVLCGPDADNISDTDGPTAFPIKYLASVSEVINASR
jgi:hypothetical protein